MLVSEDQIAIGSYYKAFSTLTGNYSADRTITNELSEGFAQIRSERYAAPYRQNIDAD